MTVCDQLNNVINDYFSSYPNVSINALAKKSGVGATTLRRIVSNTTKTGPAPHVVLAIVSAVTNEKRLSKILTSFEGPIAELLQKSFGMFTENVSGKSIPHTYSNDLNTALEDKTSYFIYKMAANRTGVKVEEISYQFGRDGIDKMIDLIEQKHLYQMDGVVHAKDKNFSLDIELAVRHIPALIKFYKYSNLSKGENLFYSLSESINMDGIKKIKEIEKNAVQEIYNIMSSPYYEGDIPYFSMMISDRMSYSESEEERVIQ